MQYISKKKFEPVGLKYLILFSSVSTRLLHKHYSERCTLSENMNPTHKI